MAKERQRARLAREHARRAEVEAAAASRERRARRDAVRRRLAPRRRRRDYRYGTLTLRQRLGVVVAFVVVQAVAWYFVAGAGPRAALAVLTVACLLVIVRTRRSPSR